MKIRILLASVLMSMTLTEASAQTMIVDLNDGTKQEFNASDVTGVEFTGSESVKYEAVDLGLSVKWATFNVGATKPEEYGDYYAWGETETKSDYSWSTYKWCNGSGTTMTKYCTSSSYGTVDKKTTLDFDDDVAHVKWGGNWRMPTDVEIDELITKCTWTWMACNGINGYKVTGTNGNSIFLPAAGHMSSSHLVDANSYSSYWSSSLSSLPYAARYVFFSTRDVYWAGTSRSDGFPVRPICQ